MDAGTTLYVDQPGASYDSHLWMVISDPKNDPVLIVNFTSWEDWKDQTCVLNVGDHPYIKNKTCVNYEGAKVQKLADLNLLIKKGLIKTNAPLSPALLKKIRDGVVESRMKLDYAELLIQQGLIEDF